jgi:hypothetical protein
VRSHIGNHVNDFGGMVAILNEFGMTAKFFQLGLLGSQMVIKGLAGGEKEHVGAM